MKAPLRRHTWLALAGTAILFTVALPIVRSADHRPVNYPPTRVRSPSMPAERGLRTIAGTSIPSRVGRVNALNFEREVLRSNQRVLVDFYADWCGPCRMLSPALEELAREMPQAKIVKVNIDESPALAAKYGVKSIPALIAFKNGRPVAGRVGMASKPQLQALLAQ